MSEPNDASPIAVKRLALQQDLYGILRGRIPEDFDVDAGLNDIRTAWQHDFE
ncbi:MAG: hypothetical protein JWN51_3733 [Phycisphaerales bacterium]|nr:hypothetical protein [Phycisphaerales bacterium]